MTALADWVEPWRAASPGVTLVLFGLSWVAYRRRHIATR
jgi:hypothetical protein